MASTYVNDLRLNEMATGDQSGSWGTVTNTNLELIAEAFSFGTESITTNANTHQTLIADGATDAGRSMFLKYTGTLDSACTITISAGSSATDFTISKLWFIENATTGSQNIIITSGSGANVTIPAGDVKVIYTDGAGSGGAVVDAFASLSVVDLKVQDDLTVADDVAIGGTLDTSGAVNLNLTTDSTSSTSGALIVDGGVGIAKKLFVGTDLDVDGTTNLDVTNIVGDLTVTGDTATFTSANSNDPNIIFKNTTNDANAPIMDFITDKDAAGADDDALGLIRFTGDNDAQEQITFARVLATVADASDGAEGGRLQLQVATHDGEIQTGLLLVDGNAEDEIDVTIGSGTSSLTSVAGNLDVTGTAQIDGVATFDDVINIGGDGLNFTKADGIAVNFKESAAITIDSDDNDSSRSFTVRSGASGSTETLIQASEDAGVALYYNNAAKIATTATGVSVNGGSSVYALHVSNDSSQIRLQHTGSGTNGFFDIKVNATAATLVANYSSAAIPIIFNTATVERMRIDASGNVLVGTAAAGGEIANILPVTAGRFRTFAGSQSAANNTATTMVTLPSGFATYIVNLGFNGINNAGAYGATAIIHTDGSTNSITQLVNPSGMTISMSGMAVQGTQTAGSTLNISFSILRM